MNRPPRVVVIGNSFAQKAQLPALRWAGDNEVVAIAGKDAERARETAETWGIERDTTDWRAALLEEPDLVLVTTPVHLHAPMVQGVLEDTRAAIICEKPLALDTSEAEAMAKAAEGRLAVIDHQLRWSPWRRRMRELIGDGFLGEPWYGRVEMCFGPMTADRPFGWWFDRKRGGGMLGAIGSHLVDLVQLELGAIASVRARLATYVPTRTDSKGNQHTVTADEHVQMWLKLANGLEVSIDANCQAPGGFRAVTEYVGSHGSLRLENESHLYGGPHDRAMREIPVETEVPTAEDLKVEQAGVFQRILPLYLRDVLDAVRSESKVLEGAATFADGVTISRVLDAARKSAADKGGWISCGS